MAELDLDEQGLPATDGNAGSTQPVVNEAADNNAAGTGGSTDGSTTVTSWAGTPVTVSTEGGLTPNAGVKEIAQNPRNEYGESVYFNGKLDNGTLNPEGPALNERIAMDRFNYHEPTPEELEKEQKKEKNDKFWASLGDTVSSLSNLYFTTQYAPNADLATRQTDAVNARYDKIKAERDKDRQNWWNARLAGRKQDQDEAEKGRGWRYKYRQAQQAARDAAAKRANDLAIAQANIEFKQRQMENTNEQNRLKRESDERNAKTAAGARVSAAAASAAGKGDDGYYYIEDEDGNVIYKTKDFNKYKARGQQLDVWVDEKTDTNTDRTATGTVTNPGYKQTQGQSKTGGYTKPVPVNKK